MKWGALAGSVPLLGLHGQGIRCAFLGGIDLLFKIMVNRHGRESALRMNRQTDRQSSQLTPVLVPQNSPDGCMVLGFLSLRQQVQSCPSPPSPHLPQ